jgi:hypothetical protein
MIAARMGGVGVAWLIRRSKWPPGERIATRARLLDWLRIRFGGARTKQDSGLSLDPKPAAGALSSNMDQSRHPRSAPRAQATLEMLRSSLRAVFQPAPVTEFQALLRALDR